MLLEEWPDLTAAGKKVLHAKCGISFQGKISNEVIIKKKKKSVFHGVKQVLSFIK